MIKNVEIWNPQMVVYLNKEKFDNKKNIDKLLFRNESITVLRSLKQVKSQENNKIIRFLIF
ncbi:hypothetical protein M153_2200028793 [Pseudoloma neurophilia]|uniref:Uncharacterized protein n=1 Tax=Pseudoloma neurophilia TaxID=146866 RepID=A0A0R0M8F3_9MICR|nr:hypothetical protein M153_2200028793 [Pseudoloma neurophilia]